MIFQYVTSNTGFVHLVEIVLSPTRSLCGFMMSGWTFGEETPDGQEATCRSCRQVAGLNDQKGNAT